MALYTASLRSFPTYSSIPRIFAKSDADVFSSDLTVKPVLISSSFNPSYLSSPLRIRRPKRSTQGVGHKGILRPTPEFQTRMKCEILVPEHMVRPIVDEILKVINRGSVPDGKIFVYEVVEAHDIRTMESGEIAL